MQYNQRQLQKKMNPDYLSAHGINAYGALCHSTFKTLNLTTENISHDNV
ncbi:hypothetical protein KVP97_09035 [Escherichia coli]|nr:hypothetical protein [Escherichia sp. MOD1-EC7003]MCH0693986.1 hypothetical protein [Escherichia coli]